MKILKISFTVACVCFTTFAFANIPVACPDLNLIKQSSQKLDLVDDSQAPDFFTVLTSKPAIYMDNREWFIATTFIIAPDRATALTKGQLSVQMTQKQENEEAWPTLHRFYFCAYDSDVPVMAISSMDGNSGQKPSPQDFKGLYSSRTHHFTK